MNFGESILKKFGWKHGDSLGKHNNGIKIPIKAHRKTNLLGFGSSTAADVCGNWWERVYDEASNNLNVGKSENGQVLVSQKDEDGVEITNKSYSLKKLKEKSHDMSYGGKFLKAATLLADVGQEKEIADHVKTEDIQVAPTKPITDEELFAACGGLTAHKGARHGLKLTGKLNRLAEQDDKLMSKLKQRTEPIQEGIFREINNHESDLKTPEWQNSTEKLKKPKFTISSIDDHPNDPQDELIDVLNIANYSQRKSKKKRQMDRKNELELVGKIETALGMAPNITNDSDGDVVCDDEINKSRQKKSKNQELDDKSKSIKKRKEKDHDYLTEKALEMIDTQNNSNDDKKERKDRKRNKKKRKQTTVSDPVVRRQLVKLKADSDSDSSINEVDVVERINEEMHHLSKKRRIDRCENITADFEKEHKKRCKKFKGDDDEVRKKPSKNQKRMEKKLCKKFDETI